VMSHRQCGNQLYVLSLKPHHSVCFSPGQFVMVAMPGERFLFRRPFSVLQQQADTGVFDIFYKLVGQGTRLMVQHWGIGDQVQVLAPLGLGFPQVTGQTLMIGGGIGIAPVYFAGLNQPLATCIYGARSQADLGLLPELQQAFDTRRLHIATDDGSYGYHGHVGQLLTSQPELMQQAKAAYICGPTPMMKAVSQQLQTANPDMAVYVSMEEHMPCGIGACTGCVVARTNGRLPLKTCVDGPVMLASEVDWDGSCWDPIPQPCTPAGHTP
jgi:dihydroorotate dehydrogenase electron transfer subunit